MPKAGYDYDTAKVLRTKGLAYSKISEQTGIPLNALARFAQRHKWDKTRDKAVASMSDAVMRDMGAFAQRHILKVTEFGDKALDNIISRGFDMTLTDLQTLANVANTFDQLVRRSMRLDEVKTSAPSIVSITIRNGETGENFAKPIIEIGEEGAISQIADHVDLPAQNQNAP